MWVRAFSLIFSFFLAFVLRNSFRINFSFRKNIGWHCVRRWTNEILLEVNWGFVSAAVMAAVHRRKLAKRFPSSPAWRIVCLVTAYLLANRQIYTISSLGFIRLYLCKSATRIFLTRFAQAVFQRFTRWRLVSEQEKKKQTPRRNLPNRIHDSDFFSHRRRCRRMVMNWKDNPRVDKKKLSALVLFTIFSFFLVI